MADRYTFAEIRLHTENQKRFLISVINGLRAAKRLQENIFQRGGLASEVKTAVDTSMVNLQQTIDNVSARIGNIRSSSGTVAWARVLKAGATGSAAIPGNLHHFNIDVDGGAAAATLAFEDIESVAITLSGAAPFAANDEVEISNSSDPSQNGKYSVNACTVSLLTLDQTLPGSDNASEESMIITLINE